MVFRNLSLLLVNFIFLVDSLAYFVGYILFLQELESVINTGGKSPMQIAYIR